jgi:peptide/nickel transport system permease protein
MADVVQGPEEGAEELDKEGLFPAAPAVASRALAPGAEPLSPQGVEGGAARPTGSMLRLTVVSFLENKLAVAGLGILVLLALFCFVGPHVYLTNQKTVNPVINNLGPTGSHLLGTDGEGFDILGRLMVAGQSSIEIGLAAGLLAAVFGTLYGAVSAVAGGFVDAIMMRIVDALFSVPALFLLILLAAIFSPNLPLMIVVISFISWLGPARLVRGEALSLRTREYVQAVKVAGGTQRRIVLRHIVPNTIGTIMVNTSFLIADHPFAGCPELPGLGAPRYHADLGRDAVERHRGDLRRVLVAALPSGRRHRPHGRGLQLRGRRATGQPRRPASTALRWHPARPGPARQV